MARRLPLLVRNPSIMKLTNPYICHSCRLLTPKLSPVSLLIARRTLTTSSSHWAIPHSNNNNNKNKKSRADPPYDPKAPLTIDHRNRLSNFFAPTGGITAATAENGKSYSILAALLPDAF